MANVTLGGNPIEVGGALPSVGAKARRSPWSART